jgi:adenosylmethionine-8-amino-7-oxononanoate aminotransferase
MAAIQLDDSDPTLGGRAVVACRSAGIMTRIMVGGGLQISPPLTITSSQVAEMSDGFRRGLDSL